MNRKSLVYKIIRFCDEPSIDILATRMLHYIFISIASIYGKSIYKKIKQEYPNRDIVCFAHSSMGDVVLANRFYQFFKETNNITESVTIFDSRLKQITQIYNFDIPCYMSAIGLYSLLTFNALYEGKIIPFCSWMFFDETYINDMKKNTNNITVKSTHSDVVNYSKKIVISPYENTVTFNKLNKLTTEFWESLVKKIKSLGFDVFTNCSGSNNEPLITGTKQFFPKYSDATLACNECYAVVAIRSGFVDLVSSTNSKLIVLYPNQEWLDTFKLEKLYDVNCNEFSYDGMSYDELSDKILDLLN